MWIASQEFHRAKIQQLTKRYNTSSPAKPWSRALLVRAAAIRFRCCG
jgi:5-methylcytosine-specific restriction endonuclease McrA